MNNSSINKLVSMYVTKYKTRDPYLLAEYLKIEIFYTPLGTLSGFYKYMKRHRCVFINSDIENENFRKFVLAHEIGHAVMHTKENCYFMDKKTFLNTSKLELQANQFAALLLISDEFIIENKTLTKEQFSRLIGYEEKITDMRIQIFRNSDKKEMKI